MLFATTADEEAGGYFGAGWMVRQRPDLIADVGFVLNEGGGGRIQGAIPVFPWRLRRRYRFGFG